MTDQCDVCTIADMNQCQCEDGYQRAPNGECINCPIQNLATGNYYEICVVNGSYACCCIGGGTNWNVNQDGSGHCTLCEPPKVFDGYNDCMCENGNDCGATCCGEEETCINGSSCCATEQVCENEMFAVCCSDGETCVNGSCQKSCTDDKPVSCQSGSDTWCCVEGSTCGTTVGQCCQGGSCCDTNRFFLMEQTDLGTYYMCCEGENFTQHKCSTTSSGTYCSCCFYECYGDGSCDEICSPY